MSNLIQRINTTILGEYSVIVFAHSPAGVPLLFTFPTFQLIAFFGYQTLDFRNRSP